MLTSFQARTGAYMTEDYELLCEPCFAQGDDFAKPISNYELDEWQSVQGQDDFYTDVDGRHSDDCYCCPALRCETCGGDILEEFVSPECEEAL